MLQESLAENGIRNDPVFFGGDISRIFRVLVKKDKRIYIKWVRTKIGPGFLSERCEIGYELFLVPCVKFSNYRQLFYA